MCDMFQDETKRNLMKQQVEKVSAYLRDASQEQWIDPDHFPAFFERGAHTAQMSGRVGV